jgi:hypothetical protein
VQVHGVHEDLLPG